VFGREVDPVFFYQNLNYFILNYFFVFLDCFYVIISKINFKK
jgi:hypothetical protein